MKFSLTESFKRVENFKTEKFQEKPSQRKKKKEVRKFETLFVD